MTDASPVGVADPPVQKRFTRGWIVLSGLFLLMSLTSGFAFYAQGVFLSALIDEQAFSTGLASAGTSVFFYTSGIFGYFTGSLIGRFDVRWVMTFGTVIIAVSIALVGEVREEWQLFAVMVVFGIGFALTGLVPATTVVTRWFQRRRAVALSIASTGLSVGGIAIAPVLAAVIDTNTLADSALAFAVILFVSLIVVLWLLVRSSPEKYGLRPDGDPPPKMADGSASTAAIAPPPGATYKHAVRSRYFIFMSAGYLLIMGAQVGVIQHLFNLTKERIGLEDAQLALITLSATSVVFRIIGGRTALRMSLRRLTTFLILVQVGGICILALADTRIWVLVGAFVMGSSVGNLLMLHPLLLADAFGVRNYPRIYGMGQLLMVLGVGSGPLVVGLIRDAVSYRLSFFVLILVCAGGLVLFRAAGNPARDYMEADAGAMDGAMAGGAMNGTTKPAAATASNGTASNGGLAPQPDETQLDQPRELVQHGRAPKVFEVQAD